MKKILFVILVFLLFACEKKQSGTFEYRMIGEKGIYEVSYFDPSTGEHTELTGRYWSHEGAFIGRSVFYLECQDTTALLYIYLFYESGGGVLARGNTRITASAWK
ncbi:MAG TPA: hypothetical protein VMV77_06430 [Bacteroidales bacterium]|nr:hypothetical protein [Bacteroidales bacterium]